MNKTELQKIGQSLKEKYFDVGIKEMTEQLRDDYRYTYKLGREMLRSFDYSHLSEEEKEKRLLNNYTDEEIEEIVSKINMSDDNYNEYLNQFNPDYMSNCSTVTDFGFDIENVCGDLRMQDYEYVRILMFNESLEYIGMLEHTDHKKYSVSAYGVDEGIKDYPECRYVITLHNHPHNLCANTDDKDTWLYNKHKDEYKEKYNVEIIDDCIISEYDFYSRKQCKMNLTLGAVSCYNTAMIDRLNKIQISEEDISNRINALVSASNAYLCEATKVILEGQRHFGENQYTDDEIADLASQAVISQKAYDEILKNMDPANMSSHSANIFGVNVAELCSDIRTLKYEVVRAIMLNDSETYIGYIEESNYSPVYISQMCINNLFDQLKHNTECKSVILIHNHPYVICANTDDGDDKSSYINEKRLNDMGIKLIDDCIISEYDFYSRKKGVI